MRRFVPILATAVALGALTACVSANQPADQAKESAKVETKGPPPRKMTALPVLPYEGDQTELLKSKDPKLAANKKLAWDFYRIILRGLQLDEAEKYMAADYIQHNPNADTGREGFLTFFRARGGPNPVPEKINDLVWIMAEGDYVTLLLSRHYQDPLIPGETYYTTWFDTFRIVDGKIVEHWDNATKGPGPVNAQ